jgi:ATP-dependent RNA helicase RhlE
MRFDQYHISAEIKRNLAQLGFKRPTDIQFKAIPSILNGEDVLAIAQTGTGKTAAFAIPVIDRIHRFKTSSRTYGIKCIVMVPTRELAMQIGEVFRELAKHTRVQTYALYGGVEQDAQIAKLQDGIDVLISTPGRMFDLFHQQDISLKSVSTLVLDEADHMLDLGFIEDIQYIKRKLTSRHQTLFFSATISDEIKKLAYSQVKSVAIRIQVSPERRVSKNVSHAVMFIDQDDKRHFLMQFLRDHPDDKVIVFVRTQVRADRVVKAMARAALAAESIHGGKDQEERSATMSRFRSGECRVLVATDVSARGIDVPDVQSVINYDLPERVENYAHRVGRTGRGHRKGDAISFCSQEERELLQAIEQFLNAPVTIIPISKKDYQAIALTEEQKVQDLRTMVAEHDVWMEKQRKKKKKKRK